VLEKDGVDMSYRSHGKQSIAQSPGENEHPTYSKMKEGQMHLSRVV